MQGVRRLSCSCPQLGVISARRLKLLKSIHFICEEYVSLRRPAALAPFHVLSWISTMKSGNCMQLSYWGFVETANDAMALIQPCSQGSLHFANRRRTASERPAVAQSGHIYIYEENPSTVQRWTDGRRPAVESESDVGRLPCLCVTRIYANVITEGRGWRPTTARTDWRGKLASAIVRVIGQISQGHSSDLDQEDI